ncbi:MAG: hypothetical protein AAF555_08080 [Verrucomicrobiota bacterium]
MSRALWHFALSLFLAFSLSAEEGPPLQLNLDELPADLVEEVVVPLPDEVFRSLDKLGKQNWHSQLIGKRLEDLSLVQSRGETALLLGMVVANGFVAVQAKDSEEVHLTGQQVLRLAEVLGVKESVLPHCQIILESARNEGWDEVRRELDRAQKSVRDSMKELRDENLAQLVSLGGWIKGTQAVAGLLLQEYQADDSEILNQPELCEYLSDTFYAMPPDLRQGEVFGKVEQGLEVLQPLLRTNADGVIEEASLEIIQSETTNVVESLLKS